MGERMTPCPRCNRHVREDSCPFCGEKCVQNAPSRIARVARATMFATAAVALGNCGTIASSSDAGDDACAPDACGLDAGVDAEDAAPIPFYGGSCPGNFCPDGSSD